MVLDCTWSVEGGAGCYLVILVQYRVVLVGIWCTGSKQGCIGCQCDMPSEHMGSEYVSREKKLSMVNFLIFVQKNVSTIRFQENKIRPFGDFEKMRFLCFYIIKSMARKGYFGPKSDFRGSKIPPRGASST